LKIPWRRIKHCNGLNEISQSNIYLRAVRICSFRHGDSFGERQKTFIDIDESPAIA
jgi:hypothetical protein